MLGNLGIYFQAVTGQAEEKNHVDLGETFPQLTMKNAENKAMAAEKVLKADNSIKNRQQYVIIGADTIVVLEDRILPKPADEADARNMLEALSGRTHRVITGISLLIQPGGRIVRDYEETKVKFRKLSPRDLDHYISTGEFADKAGAYGIQGYGVFLVDSIQGDYPNVVGLPLMKLYRLMKDIGVDLLQLAAKGIPGKE